MPWFFALCGRDTQKYHPITVGIIAGCPANKLQNVKKQPS